MTIKKIVPYTLDFIVNRLSVLALSLLSSWGDYCRRRISNYEL